MPWLVSTVTSSFGRSKVANVEPCDAVMEETVTCPCRLNKWQVMGSLTHFFEVEGEPFKAGWCLVILRVTDEQEGSEKKR